MNTQHTHQNYSIQPAARHTLSQRQARRRQRLGIVLIVVGSLWLGLRMLGWISDVPSPIGWLADSVGLLERFTSGNLALACGILTIFTSGL